MQQRECFYLAPCKFNAPHLMWRVDVLVASRVEAISPAVDKLMQLFKFENSCCPPEHEFAVELALREALANAIIHGNRQDPTKRVRVCCACDSERGVLIAVKDQGEGFDPSKIPSPLESQNVCADHGRGIHLMKCVMDEVKFRRGGTEVYIRKNTSRHG